MIRNIFRIFRIYNCVFIFIVIIVVIIIIVMIMFIFNFMDNSVVD